MLPWLYNARCQGPRVAEVAQILWSLGSKSIGREVQLRKGLHERSWELPLQAREREVERQHRTE